MHPKVWFGALLLASTCMWGQQAAHKAAGSAPGKSQEKAAAGGLPHTSPELVAAIEGSYYHPDDLVLMDCEVAVDWDSLYSGMHVEMPAEKLQALKGLKVHARAVRGRPLDLKFDWTGGTVSTQDQIEGGLKQMVGGFYQMYWPMMAGPLFAPDDKLDQIVSLPDGGAKVSASGGNTKVRMVVNRDGTPAHIEFDNAAMKAQFDLAYVSSPNPAPGDLRRMTEMKIDEMIGSSSLKFDTKVDYQDVNSYAIPEHVSFAMLGAYTVSLKFSECKASSVAISQ